MNPSDYQLPTARIYEQDGSLYVNTTCQQKYVNLPTYSPMASSSSMSSNCTTPNYYDQTESAIEQLKVGPKTEFKSRLPVIRRNAKTDEPFGFKGLSRKSDKAVIRQKTEGFGSKKPAASYVCLITMAIEDSEEKQLSLNEIYNWIIKHFPYYEKDKTRWQNSVRHCLSFNDCFVSVKRPPGQAGKGNLWRMHNECQNMMTPNSFMRREKRFKVTGKIRKRSVKPKTEQEIVEAKEKIEDIATSVRQILESSHEAPEVKEECADSPAESPSSMSQPSIVEEEKNQSQPLIVVPKLIAPVPLASVPLPPLRSASETYEVEQYQQYAYLAYHPSYAVTPTAEKSLDLYNGTSFSAATYGASYPGWTDLNTL